MPSSWRALSPKSSRKHGAKSALRKRAFRSSILALGVACVASSMVSAFYFFSPSELESADSKGFMNDFHPPVAEVSFSTDGVLTQRWIRNWLGPIRQRNLLDMNIEEIQRELMGEEQIIECVVSREFPATLKVQIRERDPILVLRMRNSSSQCVDWLVSCDGHLYQGEGYSSGQLLSLPSLRIDSQKIRKSTESVGYVPLEGIPFVFPLIELARREYPEIYRDWKIISFERPDQSDPGAHVLVEAGRIGKVRFSPGDYSSQLKRLRYLLDEPQFARSKFIRSIDLSHGRSVFARI